MAESFAATNEDIAALRKENDDYIKNVLTPKYNDLTKTMSALDKVREKTEVLDGSRQRGAIGKAAVRYEDLRAISRFPSVPPNNRFLGSPPTADDYNKLAADVKKLYEMLGTLASNLSLKI